MAPLRSRSVVRRRRALGGALSIAALLAFAEGGCSSSSDAPSLPPCSITAPSQDEFCTALADYDGRCGRCEDCIARNLQNCETRSSAISAAHRAAFIACKDAMPCVANASLTQCIQRQMQKAAPTSAQQQAKDAYCAACSATNAADCTNFFALSPSSSKNGPGYSLLLAGDQTANRAVMLCSSKCDPFDYGICVALIMCAEAGGDFCVDAGFCAPQSG